MAQMLTTQEAWLHGTSRSSPPVIQAGFLGANAARCERVPGGLASCSARRSDGNEPAPCLPVTENGGNEHGQAAYGKDAEMIEIRNLDPHDAVPDGRGHRVIVIRRFDEDDPHRIVTEIILTAAHGRTETAQPHEADGSSMTLDHAIAAARKVAETEGIGAVFVLDRTAGRLEHEVVEHHGDHSFPGRTLDDTDSEDGERGTDMRDRSP